jgi:hypothetical protein
MEAMNFLRRIYRRIVLGQRMIELLDELDETLRITRG